MLLGGCSGSSRPIPLDSGVSLVPSLFSCAFIKQTLFLAFPSSRTSDLSAATSCPTSPPAQPAVGNRSVGSQISGAQPARSPCSNLHHRHALRTIPCFSPVERRPLSSNPGPSPVEPPDQTQSGSIKPNQTEK